MMISGSYVPGELLLRCLWLRPRLLRLFADPSLLVLHPSWRTRGLFGKHPVEGLVHGASSRPSTPAFSALWLAALESW